MAGRGLPQYRYGPGLSETACRQRLGILPAQRHSADQDGRRDADMEAAVLVLDQVVQSLAIPYRGLVWPVRFQPCTVLPELHGGAGRTSQAARGSRSQRHSRFAAVARPASGGTVLPGGSLDDPVEFIVHMDRE